MQVTSAVITGPDAARFSIVYGHNCVSQTYNAGSSCGMASALPLRGRARSKPSSR